MKTNKTNQTPLKARNSKAACPPTVLKRLTTAAACLLLCLCVASCSQEESNTLPDGGEYPHTGKRMPLLIGGADVATYSVTTADTRAVTSSVENWTTFLIYVFRKVSTYTNPTGYEFLSYGMAYVKEDGTVGYMGGTKPYYYENATIRVVAVSNGEIYDSDFRGEWMDAQPKAPNWGSYIGVDLNNDCNFMAYDSGDFVATAEPLQLTFRYYTSQVVIFLPDVIAVDFIEQNLGTTGSWKMGEANIIEASRVNNAPYGNKRSTTIYHDNRFAAINPSGLYYIKYSVIPTSELSFPRVLLNSITTSDGYQRPDYNTEIFPYEINTFEKGKLYPYLLGRRP